MAGQQPSLMEGYLTALASGTLNFQDANDSRLEPMQRQALLIGLSAQAATAGSVVDTDDDSDNLILIQTAIGDLEAALVAAIAASDQDDDLAPLTAILTELQTQSSDLSDLLSSSENIDTQLLTIRNIVTQLNNNFGLFRVENGANLTDIETDLETIQIQLNSIGSMVLSLFDYEEQIGYSDTAIPRLIIRSTWINKTTGVKTVQYYELDGVTVTADEFDPNPSQTSQFFYTEESYKQEVGGVITSLSQTFTKRVVREFKDGVLSVVNETWYDSSDVFLVSAPASVQQVDLLNASEKGGEAQIVEFDMGAGAGAEALLIPLSIITTKKVRSLTIVCDELDDNAVFRYNAPNGNSRILKLGESISWSLDKGEFLELNGTIQGNAAGTTVNSKLLVIFTEL